MTVRVGQHERAILGKESMPRIVIFCEGYDNIKCTLQMILLNYLDHTISLVIPGYYDLFKFYQAINEKVLHNAINVIYLEPFHPERAKVRGLRKTFHILPDIIGEKRYLRETYDKYFTGLETSEVFFFSRGTSGIKYYLLKKLTKQNNKMVCISTGPSELIPYTPTDIVGLATLAISRLIYGHDIAVSKIPTYKGFPYIPDSFMKKNVDRVMDWTEVEEMMNGFDSSPFKVFHEADKYCVIYFDSDLVGVGYVPDEGLYRRELAIIFDIVKKYFPVAIATKYHPGQKAENWTGFGDTLPQFIPAEFLYNEKTLLYLSIISWSIAHVEKGMAVSVANLITFKSAEVKNKLQEMLIQASKSKILFPKSLDEFELICSNLKREKGSKISS